MKVNFQGASTCALCVGLLDVVLTLIILYPFGGQATALSYLFGLIKLVAFAGALWYYKKNYKGEGTFTYGAGIKVGLVIGLFYGIIMGALQFCLFQFDNQLVARMTEELKKAVAQMQLPPEMANQMMDSMQISLSPITQGFGGFFNTIVFALFASLIAMIFLKEKEDYNSAMQGIQ
ncbi:MAG: DUF4199 domain-containing protein [Bacteroidales bacterium]|nr:DUF4199 domain-containing protein [Bacteroidales bacterium]